MAERKKKIRFCPICRVSTPGQAEHGVSLDVQKERNIRAVEFLGGTIPDDCWEYSGQESATQDKERELYFAHLDNCDKDLFDAVIFDENSRFNRDPVTNDRAIKTYLKNGIKFFIGTSELDLDNPDHLLLLDINAATNKHWAAHLRRKTVAGKLKKAQMAARGECKVPISKKRLPFAREQNKEAGKWVWQLDKRKAKLMQWAAEEILSGKSTRDVCDALATEHELPMHHSYLRKVLTKRCGDTWTYVGVTFDVPRILDEPTIQTIKERFEGNKWRTRPDVKKYALSGFLRHSECGETLYPGSPGGYQYYRHQTGKHIPCKQRPHIPVKLAEDTVFDMFFDFNYDRGGFQKAMNEYIGDENEIENLEKRIRQLEKSLESVDRQLDRLVDMRTSDEPIDKDTYIKKHAEYSEKRNRFVELLEKKQTKFNSLQNIDRLVEDAREVYFKLREKFDSAERRKKMTYNDKVNLLHYFFSGKDEDGKPYGIYIQKNDGGDFEFELYGRYIIGPDTHSLIKLRPAIHTFRTRKTTAGDDLSVEKHKERISKKHYQTLSLTLNKDSR